MENFEKQPNQLKPSEEMKNNESSKRLKESQEKSLKLEEIRHEVENIGDRIGKPIDEGIKETVVMFKANGLPTSDSCEGHIERSLPVPYVEVSAPNEPQERFVGQNEAFEKVAKKYNITIEEAKTSKIDGAYWEAKKEYSQNEETEEYKKWNKENEKLLAKGQDFLEEFYKDRQVEPNVKLQIEEGVGNFRIHNGGEDYHSVIEEEQKFTEDEKRIRTEKVEKYRAEMNEFTEFLQKKFMGDFNSAEFGLQPESEKLSEISKENIERLKTGFIKSTIEKGMFASEAEVLKAIEQEKEAIEEEMTLTVNLSPESIARFFEKGKQETLWDYLKETESLENIKRGPTMQGKDLHSEYISYRETAENDLKQFVPEEFQDKKPVYGALAGGTNRDSERGACPEYGNLFFELDMTQLGKSTLNFNDSFANVEKKEDGIYHFDESSLLAIDDAREAKAVVNLMKKYK